MARRPEYDRSVVLERATELFWRKGYEATSMSDLLAATGLSRSSLYAEFGSKNSLFILAYDQYRRDRAERLDEVLSQHEAPEGLRRFFQDIAHAQEGGLEAYGCMSTNQAVELATLDDVVRAKVQEDYDLLEKRFIDYLLDGQRRGTVPESANVRTAASALVTAFSGFQLSVRGGLDRERLDRALEYLLQPLGHA